MTSLSTNPLPGGAELLTDGYFVASIDKSGEIIIYGVVGDSRHGHFLPFAHSTGG